MEDYLESILSYKFVILETSFDEREYKLLDLYSSYFQIFLIIHIFGVGSKFWWVDEIFAWLHGKWDYNLSKKTGRYVENTSTKSSFFILPPKLITIILLFSLGGPF